MKNTFMINRLIRNLPFSYNKGVKVIDSSVPIWFESHRSYEIPKGSNNYLVVKFKDKLIESGLVRFKDIDCLIEVLENVKGLIFERGLLNEGN